MNQSLVPPPTTGSEKSLLLGFLRYQQGVFLKKLTRSDGSLLDEDSLSQPLPPSTMTLKGMAGHLWLVEDYWRQEIICGQPELAPWSQIDWDATPDADWEITQSAAEITENLRASISLTHQVLAELDWEQPTKGKRASFPNMSIRWVAIHLLEEWARHLGHADLLREAIDGATGD